MSSNKVNNKLDFRNVKQTQLDPGQTLKGSFSELQSSLRSYGTNAVLKDAYTDIIQISDVDGRPIDVEYWQATSTSIDKLQFNADVAGDKAGTYFVLQEYTTKNTHAFYYIVSGSGTAPGVADIETPISIVNNDPASVIAFATKVVLDTIEEFRVSQESVLSTFLEIEYKQFGDTDLIDVATSGYVATRLETGESFKVGEIELEYDVDGDPIYNGNTLKGLVYNLYTASFDVSPEAIPTNPDGSINARIVKDYDNFEVTARDSSSNITQVEYNMGATLVRTVDLTYDSEGCLLTYVETDA